MNGSGRSNNIPFPMSFQNSISALDSYRAAVQPALSTVMHSWTSASFYLLGSVHSMCNNAQSRLATSLPVVNIQLSDRIGRLWWVTEQKKDGAKCGCSVLEERSTRFFFKLCLAYYFKWQSVEFIYFLCDTFPTVLTARCLLNLVFWQD